MKRAERTIAQVRKIFIVITLFLVALTIYVFAQIKNFAENTALVTHADRVNLALGKSLVYLLNAETNQRGYLLTGDSTLLDQKDADLKLVNEELKKLDTLSQGNDRLQQKSAVLRGLVNDKLQSMRKVLLTTTAGLVVSPQKDEIKAGVLKMNRVRATVKLMVDSEKVLLDEQTSRYNRVEWLTPFLIVILFLGSLLILFASYTRVNRAYRRAKTLQEDIALSNTKLEKKNEELVRSQEAIATLNQSYEYAEQVGLFGSYRYNFARRELFYSDNLFRLLGVEPNTFEPNVEKFLEFVHPDDKQYVKEATAAAFLNKEVSRWEYRMNTANGKMIYVRGTGKLIRTGDEIVWMVGTLQDITEEKMLEISLKDNNETLERMNKELQSFAYISGHDLQEPLRKIQVFVDQIRNTDGESLSAESADKFLRIQNAASRMQQLIDDLLEYSRTATAERKYEKVNLNALTAEVVDSLREEKASSHATINVSSMCEASVIPFQFRQLLYNLISNALKFHAKDRDPVISISAKEEKVVPPDSSDNAAQEYCHISIQDNGIGFEQEYSERIFRVFQRLNGKQEYPGTGIGLAIVKKIVENHEGFITVKSKVGEGTGFEVYLRCVK